MEYFTYVLLSLGNGDIYVGSTEDLDNRVKRHNSGRVKSTKSNRPWKLLECHKFNSRSEAIKFERFLKTHQQKDIIRERYKLK